MDTIKIKDMGVVIAAGGSGERFISKHNGNKLLADIGDTPVFMCSVIRFMEVCPLENIIIVVPCFYEDDFKKSLSAHPGASAIKIVHGGETRMNSVYLGLLMLPETLKFVAVQDAARPLITKDLILSSYKFAKAHGSAVVGKKMADTVKKADGNGFVLEDVDREGLWAVETPQVFKRQLLIDAYEKAFEENFAVTDDAGVMKYAGHAVKMFEYRGKNTKITYNTDLSGIMDYITLAKHKGRHS